MYRPTHGTLGVAAVFWATSVALSAQGQSIPTAPEPLRPVSFARIAANIPAGSVWAHVQTNDGIYGCRDFKVLTWESSAKANVEVFEFERVFREELAQAGFKVAGDPTNLFEDDQKSSDLQVGVLITGLDATFCASQNYWDMVAKNDHVVVKGSVTMHLQWQIYSTSQGKILARIPTDATYGIKKPIDGGNVLVMQRVFAANVQALTTSPAFRATLAAPAAAASSTLMAPLAIAGRKAVVAMPLNQAARDVVTIFAGNALGSGLMISTDGYILTNHHVAGEAGQVRVRWPDGTDTVGAVVRTDRRRDVALIKTTPPKGLAPLAIRHTPVQLGETVYAIGTPREREFAGTLTRGVVSTVTREIEGLNYIQSDVAITHGNSGGPLLDEKGWVVGISQSAYEPDGVSQNINFFIPIDDALRALALTAVG